MGSEVIKRSVYAALSAGGVNALAAWRHRRHAAGLMFDRAAVLMYHGATDRSWPGVLNCERNHIAVGALATQLRWIRSHRAVISLSRYAASLRGGDSIPERSAVLTFDDGYQNNYSLVYPLLRELNLPAVFFIATNFIEDRSTLWVDRLETAFHRTRRSRLILPQLGKRWAWETPAQRVDAYLRAKALLKNLDGASRDRILEEVFDRLAASPIAPPSLFDPMTPGQLRELAASGLVEIGAHSCRHDVLTHLDDGAAQREIAQSRVKTFDLCGRTPALFSYPNGAGSPRLAKKVEEAGYTAAVEGNLRLNAPKGVCPYRIDRIALHESDTRAMIEATLGGLRQYLLRRG